MLKKRTIVLAFLGIVGLSFTLGVYFLVEALRLKGPPVYVIGLLAGGFVAVLYFLTLSGPVISVAVVITEGDTLLLVEQTEGGEWGLPAGHVEIGESLAEAARREAKEETGAEIILIGIQGLYTIPKEGLLEVGIVFHARRSVKGMLQPVEPDIRQARWFTREEVKALLKEGRLYRSAFNRRTIGDWLKKKRYPLDLLDESPLD
jgi:ADP-ribose pyrophosphatase YjhB (NUDIX family)